MTATAIPPVTQGEHAGEMPMVGRPDVFRRQLARLGWMFSAPALIVVAAVTIFPIVYSIIMSFSSVQETAAGFSLGSFTLHNYSLLIHSGVWQYALVFTLIYTLVTVSVELLIGTGIALVLERLTRGRGPMMALLLIPWSIITVISAELWKYMYDPTFGVITKIMADLGLGNNVILGNNTSAVIAMMVADIWKTTPFVTIIILAGLVMLPQDIYEAAEVDGASPWRTFWTITFPLLRPTIALAVLFRVLQAFGLFDLPEVLTTGGPGHATTSLAILGYQAMFTNESFGPGAAVATSTAALVVIGCTMFLRVFKSQAAQEN